MLHVPRRGPGRTRLPWRSAGQVLIGIGFHRHADKSPDRPKLRKHGRTYLPGEGFNQPSNRPLVLPLDRRRGATGRIQEHTDGHHLRHPSQ